jgi:hypothetical protein
MGRFFTRKETHTISREGSREVVRVRFMQGDWILRQEFWLAEKRPDGITSSTNYSTQAEAERALFEPSGAESLVRVSHGRTGS